MTHNQIDYWSLQERIRNDRVTEQISRDSLTETTRHNKQSEQLSKYATDKNYAASIYSADKHYAASIYGADRSYAASVYATNVNQATQRYVANLNAQTSRYVADTQSATARINKSFDYAASKYSANKSYDAAVYSADTHASTEANLEAGRNARFTLEMAQKEYATNVGAITDITGQLVDLVTFGIGNATTRDANKANYDLQTAKNANELERLQQSNRGAYVRSVMKGE